MQLLIVILNFWEKTYMLATFREREQIANGPKFKASSPKQIATAAMLIKWPRKLLICVRLIVDYYKVKTTKCFAAAKHP
jgi:hypothetical protein